MRSPRACGSRRGRCTSATASRPCGTSGISTTSTSEPRRLEALAGPSVEFLGWLDDVRVADLFARCRAFIFPTLEDFGITPLEAMASGRPVIALGQGGARETVVPPGGADPPTGLLFE